MHSLHHGGQHEYPPPYRAVTPRAPAYVFYLTVRHGAPALSVFPILPLPPFVKRCLHHTDVPCAERVLDQKILVPPSFMEMDSVEPVQTDDDARDKTTGPLVFPVFPHL